MSDVTTILADDALLAPFLESRSCAGRIAAFVRQQLAAWPALREAHEGLARSLYRKLFLADCEVELQHNPSRMKSSTARVDSRSVSERACFLCPGNLYPEQRALAFNDDWLVLCNPFPIFPGHLVVSHRRHVAQELGACLREMLLFVAGTRGAYEAFYNGPACGASAPDHLHFQAYPEGGIPIVAQAGLLTAAGMGIAQVSDMAGQGACFAGEIDRRGIFICRSRDAALVAATVLRAVEHLGQVTAAQAEPLVNIIVAADGPELVAILLPRRAHRPACYFADGAERMLVSPGAVDTGGLLVLPRREDYERMTREHVMGIFSQVCEPGAIFKGFAA